MYGWKNHMTGRAFAPGPAELLAHEEFMRRLAIRLLGDEHHADDVVQETWLAALQKPPRHGANVRGWLSRVVRNLSLKRRRSETRLDKRHARAAAPLPAESASGAVARVEMQRHVVEAVHALEEPYRSVVTLRYFDDLAPAEIARRTGVPKKTVETRLRRAIRRLRDRLDEQHHSDRRGWCRALLPLSRPHSAAAAGITLLTGGIMTKKLAAAGFVLLALAGTFLLWDGEAAPETRGRTVALRDRASTGTSRDAAAGVAASGEKTPPHGTARKRDRFVVTGTVADSSGTPLPDAQVRIVPLWPSGELKFMGSSPSVSGPDDRGCYRALLRPGLYAFVAKCGRLHSPRRELEVSGDVTVDLLVFPGPAELRVDLVPAYAGVDAAVFRLSTPFEGDLSVGPSASVVLRDLHLGDRVGLVVKFPNGHYAYPANPNLENHLTSFQRYTVRMNQERQRYEVRIGRFGILRGRVVSPGGRGIRTGKVQALMDSAYKPKVDLKRDDSKPWPEGYGYFSMRVIPERPLSLFLASPASSAGALGMRRPLEISPLAAGEKREIRIELESLPGLIRGRIDAPGATAFDGITVRGYIRVGSRGHGYWQSTKVFPDGRFRLEGLPWGKVRLTVSLAEGSPWAKPLPLRLKLEEEENRDVGTIRLTKGGVLHGAVRYVPDDRRYASRSVDAVPLIASGERDWFSRRTTKTDARGHYRFERLAAGRYELHLGSTSHVVATVTVIDRGEQELDLVKAPLTKPKPR